MMKSNHDGPVLEAMTRRDFIRLSGFAVGGVVTAQCVAARGETCEPEAASTPPEKAACTVVSFPSHNPGFAGRSLGDKGVLLWTNGFQDDFKGYHLNINAKNVWRLCNGRRSAEEICSEYYRQTRRPEAEAEAFLRQLLAAGVVVCGGKIRAAGGFKVFENAAFVVNLD